MLKEKTKTKKTKKWMKFRHRVVRNLAFCVLYPYSKWKYGITVEKFREQGDRSYLILFNHQTAFDQFFVGMAFKGPVYYVASEDLFSMGWVSKLIRWVVAPIPIKKQTTDLNAVMNCIRVAREGGTIAIAHKELVKGRLVVKQNQVGSVPLLSELFHGDAVLPF